MGRVSEDTRTRRGQLAEATRTRLGSEDGEKPPATGHQLGCARVRGSGSLLGQCCAPGDTGQRLERFSVSQRGWGAPGSQWVEVRTLLPPHIARKGPAAEKDPARVAVAGGWWREGWGAASGAGDPSRGLPGGPWGDGAEAGAQAAGGGGTSNLSGESDAAGEAGGATSCPASWAPRRTFTGSLYMQRR